MNQKNESGSFCISDPLAKAVLDSISAQIAILDHDGVILETNKAWREYAEAGNVKEKFDFTGVNYLSICEAANGIGADDAHEVAAGIRSVISGKIKEFAYDYPSHSPSGKHWHYMRAIRIAGRGPKRIVVSHSDITALKLAEEALIEREHERDQLRHSLELAMEVQQNLLPKTTPQIKGLDIAAESKYCDETGGDYFDFLEFNEPQGARVSVVIGDVSGHGIPAALLMASARSALRQRSKLAGSVSQIISDVNRLITEDVEESGRFITMFYLTVDPTQKALYWIRAGHEPALFYDQKKNTFEELKGKGAALGLSLKSSYEKNIKADLGKGNIVVLLSDGISEARNTEGQMFGTEAIKKVIQKHSHLSAKEILDNVFQEVIQFQGGNEFEDDTTIAVIKVVEDL